MVASRRGSAQTAHGLQVSRDARRLYVSNRLEGSISVIDFSTNRVVAKWVIPGKAMKADQ